MLFIVIYKVLFRREFKGYFFEWRGIFLSGVFFFLFCGGIYVNEWERRELIIGSLWFRVVALVFGVGSGVVVEFFLIKF